MTVYLSIAILTGQQPRCQRLSRNQQLSALEVDDVEAISEGVALLICSSDGKYTGTCVAIGSCHSVMMGWCTDEHFEPH